MIFVEWLRVRNCLKVLAIVLGVFLAIALILRVGLNKEIDQEGQLFARYSSPGTVVTNSVLPDGAKRTTMVDAARHTTVTIDKYWDGDLHVVVDAPANSSDDVDFKSAEIGSMHANSDIHGNVRVTTIDTNGTIEFYYFVLIGSVVALIIATCVAAPFSRERDGHLEIALTRPVSRVNYALGAIGADLACILLSNVMTIVALTLALAIFEIPHFAFNPMTGYVLMSALLLPFAWYAMICAATASLSRGYGAVLGFAWPATLVIVFLAVGPLGNTVLASVVHDIFWVISRFSPLAYGQNFGVRFSDNGTVALRPDYWIDNLMLLVLFIVYSALAVFQWRRAEA